MLTYDYDSRVADPAITSPEMTGDFALAGGQSDDMTADADAQDDGATPLFALPVLDRIRTSD